MSRDRFGCAPAVLAWLLLAGCVKRAAQREQALQPDPRIDAARVDVNLRGEVVRRIPEPK